MTPFMQFRSWARDGAAGERLVVALVTALVTALVAWSLRPVASAPAGTATAAEPAPGAVPTSAAPPVAAAPSPAPSPAAVDARSGVAGLPAPPTQASSVGGAGTASAPPSTSIPAPPGGCDRQATDQGVTAEEIRAGVIIYSLGETNAALGIPSADETIKMYNAVFAQYNARGGIQCRKLVGRYYEVFLLDPSAPRAACLKAQEDRIFVMFNNLDNCVVQAGIPNFWALNPSQSTVRQFFPYVMTFQSDYERLARDFVLGAKEVGFFNGMAKLGLLEHSCSPDRTRAVRANLARIGIRPEQMSVYNYGCPSTLPTADQHLAAVVQFRRDGVTHVTSSYRLAPEGFANAAQQQGFHPKYAFPDDAFSSLMSNANPPYSENLDGALIIAKGQEGAEYTPGATFTQATRDCAAIAKSVGLPGPTNTGTLAGSLHALACIHTKMFATAAKATIPLTRRGLVNGLATVGPLDLSFPAGPADFRDPGNPTGSQFWRPVVYHADCTCVRLLDQRFRPEFR